MWQTIPEHSEHVIKHHKCKQHNNGVYPKNCISEGYSQYFQGHTSFSDKHREDMPPSLTNTVRPRLLRWQAQKGHTFRHGQAQKGHASFPDKHRKATPSSQTCTESTPPLLRSTERACLLHYHWQVQRGHTPFSDKHIKATPPSLTARSICYSTHSYNHPAALKHQEFPVDSQIHISHFPGAFVMESVNGTGAEKALNCELH